MDNRIMNVPLVLMQKVLNYLASRPYQEVFGLVEEIRKLPPATGSDTTPASASNVTPIDATSDSVQDSVVEA